MELKIDRDILLKGMSRVKGILEKRSHIPILSTVLFATKDNDLELSATDLEISFRDRYPIKIIQPGQVTISGEKLLAIAQETNAAEIHISEKDNNWIYVSDGNARYNLACLSADDFPVLIEPEGTVMVEIDGKILSEMMAKTVYAVLMEDAGYKLSGVFMEVTGEGCLRMVATDGHRLSLIDKQLPDIEKVEIGSGVMIPKKGIVELNKLSAEGMVSLGLKQNNLVAKKETTLIVIRLLDARFPDYRAVIPSTDQENVVTVDKHRFLGAIRRMMILRSEQHQGVKINIDKDSLELAFINPDLGNAEEKIGACYGGEPMELGFNPKYFIDALQPMDSDVVYLNIKDQSSPCLITGDQDEGFLGLIMPMRVQ